MNKRKLKLIKYGISEHRYMELQSFCRQYGEWQKKLQNKDCALGSPKYDGMPKSGHNSDSTADLAIMRAVLTEKMEMVDRCIEKAACGMDKFLRLSVCDGVPLGVLKGKYGLPCERSAFFDMRRYFYYLLNQEMENLEKKLF